MTQTLIMKTEATYSLNFLIYLQNIFLNQIEQPEKYRFPYMPTAYSFHGDFEKRYKQLWQELAEKIQLHPSIDMKVFSEEQELFYNRLFRKNSQSFDGYINLRRSFHVWWESLAGHFSMERALDDKGVKVYRKLMKEMQRENIEPEGELTISILYDECRLCDISHFPYFVTVSIDKWHNKDKELLDILKTSIN